MDFFDIISTLLVLAAFGLPSLIGKAFKNASRKGAAEAGDLSGMPPVEDVPSGKKTFEDILKELMKEDGEDDDVVEFPVGDGDPEPVQVKPVVVPEVPKPMPKPVVKPVVSAVADRQMTDRRPSRPVVMEEKPKDKFVVDPKKMVIYSEIMKPKFDD